MLFKVTWDMICKWGTTGYFLFVYKFIIRCGKIKMGTIIVFLIPVYIM